MSIELSLLAWSILLGLVHLLATGVFNTAQNGLAYGMGPRDEPRPVTGIGGRVRRAYDNFLQSFAFFAAAVLALQYLGRHSGLTVWGANLYFWGRLVYIPLYAAGVPLVRTLAWGVSILGIVLLLIALA